jgi:hypothetical protein
MIFIVNKGFPWYLRYVAEQIEITNGRGSLRLVLDKEYPEARNFSTLLMGDFSKMAKEFAGVHKSFWRDGDPHHEFELIWFQRYMFVLEYLESIGHTGDFWIVDSDVMLFSDLKDARILPGKRFTRNKEQDPCFTWFADTSMLREFCEYILDYYRNRLSEIEEYWIKNYIEGEMRGGICEMTFLKWFADERPSTCQDLSLPIEGWAFDRGIHERDEYRENLFLGGKKIYWSGKTPFGNLNGRRVKFYGLHCQGEYKNLIPLYFSGSPDPDDVKKARAWKRSIMVKRARRISIRKIVGRW